MSNALRNWEIKSGFPFGEGLTLEELADGAGDILLDMPKIIATAKAEALRAAKEAIKLDLQTFRDCGRKDIKGHVRAIMLIDELLANKEGKNGYVELR